MSDPTVYLLRIYDAAPQVGQPNRVVAEAQLVIHDPEAAWRIFEQSWGTVASTIMVGKILDAMRIATGRWDPPGIPTPITYVALAMVGSPEKV